MIYGNSLERVGNTPLVKLAIPEFKNIRVYAKLEMCNPTGSVKDRAAFYILKKIIADQIIDKNTTILESSSGNFGVALAAYTNLFGLKFKCVVDPHISPVNKMLIEHYGGSLISVTEPDDSGGYLLNRIKKVNELLKLIPNSYWINQYENWYNSEAYYESLGYELVKEMGSIDYAFMGVSSGGTITGVSRKIKEHFPNAKIFAVDITGSVIFGHPPKKRYIPGIGSSIRPGILKQAKLDGHILVDEATTVKMCLRLLKDNHIFAGGSSGSVFAGILKFFKDYKENRKLDVVTIFADRGERYTDTIYNERWAGKFIKKISNPDANSAN